MEIAKEVGNWTRIQRSMRKLTQRELSEKIGFGKDTSKLSKVENGKASRNLTIIEFIKICEVFEKQPGVVLDKLLAGESALD